MCRIAHVCTYQCAQMQYTIQHATFLVFPVNFYSSPSSLLRWCLLKARGARHIMAESTFHWSPSGRQLHNTRFHICSELRNRYKLTSNSRQNTSISSHELHRRCSQSNLRLNQQTHKIETQSKQITADKKNAQTHTECNFYHSPI